MVPNEFRKTLCLLAGFVTLVEAVVWGAAAIYSIGVFHCAWEFNGVERGVSSWTLLYVTYFIGDCRGSKGADSLGYSLTDIPNTPAKCLQVWMWIYAILSVVWIPACLLLIGGVQGEVKGRKGAFLYYPWTSLTLVLIILDFAAALYHLVDVFQTAIPDDYAKFTASETWDTLTNLSSADVSTWLPSFYLTLFFCRLLVLWILNIFFFYTVSKASIAVSQYKTEYLQTSSMKANKKNDSDPTDFQNQSTTNIVQQMNKTEERELRNLPEIQQNREFNREDKGFERLNHLSTEYRNDQLRAPIEEEISEYNAAVYGEGKERLPKKTGSPYISNRFDYTSRPTTPDSLASREHWHERPPPLASGIKIPPELNKIGSFSYTAGDQPQLLASRTNLSRSNSRAEGQYPHIPRPDYTIAERRTASLEFVPNRFKVPAPKRPQSVHSVLAHETQASTSHKVAPVPPKKPQGYLRSALSAEEPRISRTRYIPPSQQLPPSQQVFYTPQSNNYNINKLY